jgi:hypothetical protein
MFTQNNQDPDPDPDSDKNNRLLRTSKKLPQERHNLEMSCLI